MRQHSPNSAESKEGMQRSGFFAHIIIYFVALLLSIGVSIYSSYATMQNAKIGLIYAESSHV
jgi:hypothetical protein